MSRMLDSCVTHSGLYVLRFVNPDLFFASIALNLISTVQSLEKTRGQYTAALPWPDLRSERNLSYVLNPKSIQSSAPMVAIGSSYFFLSVGSSVDWGPCGCCPQQRLTSIIKKNLSFQKNQKSIIRKTCPL